MMRTKSVDVLVIGAGVAGVTLALQLKQRNLEILLVERAIRPPQALRGEYLQPGGVHLASAFGIISPIREGGSSVRGVQFHDLCVRNGRTIGFSATLEEGSPGLTIRGDKLGGALFQLAERALGENFKVGAQLVPDRSSLEELLSAPAFVLRQHDREPIQVVPRWVIACDGRSSTVRRWIEGDDKVRRIALPRHDFSTLLAAYEASAESVPSAQQTICRMPRRGAIIAFPLSSDRSRIYWVVPRSERNTNPRGALWLEYLFSHSSRELPVSVDRNNTQWVGCAPCSTRWHGVPCHGRFMFVGDAAYTTTPIAGQGMTCALTHVNHLLQTIDFREQRPSSRNAMLQQYGSFIRDRFTQTRLLASLIELLFFSNSSWTRPLTARVVEQWNLCARRKGQAVRRFSGLEHNATSVRELLWILGWNLGTADHLERRA